MGTRSVQWWVLVVALLGALPGAAGEVAPANETVTVNLKDGGRLVGTIVTEDEVAITLRTGTGMDLKLLRDAIASVEGGRGTQGGAPPVPTDPNDTRLMFAPTGRPLGKGNGYVSNHYVLFPGFAFGLTKNVSVGGGVSTIPGVGLDQQLFYVSAQAGFRPSEKVAFALGGLYTKGGDDEDLRAAVPYAVATFGRPMRSLTLGFALALTPEEEYHYGPRGQFLGSSSHWRSEPIVMVGGEARVGRRLAFVTESWLFVQRPISEQAFGLALRFFSNRISFDAGFVIVPELIDEGFPIPWLSVSYHFGPSRSRETRRGPEMGGLDRARRAAR